MKIGSWNVSGYRKSISLKIYDYEKDADIQYFASILKDLDLDVLFIQESLASGSSSYAKELGMLVGLTYLQETLGSKSYIEEGQFESLSVLSKKPISAFHEIDQINPNWTVAMPNGYLAKSYDRKFQVMTINDMQFVHTHFLPERFFNKNYLIDTDRRYIDDNMVLLDKLQGNFVFCGDLNTKHVDLVFSEFFNKHNLLNAFQNIPTRPVLEGGGIAQDVICFPKEFQLLSKETIKTQTDHYFICAEIAK